MDNTYKAKRADNGNEVETENIPDLEADESGTENISCEFGFVFRILMIVILLIILYAIYAMALNLEMPIQ